MKIIDLLNKIAKGEEVPKKFKDNYHTYELIKYPCCGVEVTNYKDEEGDYLFGCEYELMLILNDEVKIIEEEKKIKKIMGIDTRETRDCIIKFQEKFNEIIDVINDMRDKEC